MMKTVHAASGRRYYPLAFFLELLVGVCALLCFLMLKDGVGELEGWIFLAAAAVLWPLTFREVTDNGGFSISRPPHFLTAVLSILLMVPILRRMNFRYVAEPLLESLLVMFAMRLFERRSPREYVQIALITLGAVVVYALLSVERLFLTVCMSMGFFGSMMLMLAGWMKREPNAVASVTDIRRIAVRSACMFVMMLPLCLVLFFLAPRVRSPFLFQRGGLGSTSGFTDRMELGGISSIQQSDKLAFRAEMDKLSVRMPYWRGAVFSLFNGSSWTVNYAGRHSGWDPSPHGGTIIRQNIYMEPSGHRWVFTLDRPLNIGDGAPVTYTGSGTFMQRTGGAIRYSVISVLTPPSGVMTQRDRNVFLQLPPDCMPPVRVLAEELTSADTTPKDKMNSLMNHLQSDLYTGTLRGLPQGPDALEQFILTNRRGNCEFFASALCVMLRMTDVPARIVGGYRGGEYNAAGGYYAVRDRMAHVWVEAWDDESEIWTRLDPAHTIIEDDMGVVEEPGGWDEFWDYLDYQWNRYFVTYSSGEQSRMAESLRALFRGRGSSQMLSFDLGRHAGAAASSVPLAAGALLAFAILIWQARRFTLRAKNPTSVLLTRFDRITASRGFVRSPSEGLEEFSFRLPERVRVDAFSFVRSLEDIMYGGREPTGGLLSELRSKLDVLEKAIRN